MVTVATNLDVPIKLLFPRPGTTSTGVPALAMLGLGDIVIPGIVVAMALRWDLWRFYEQQRQALLCVSLDGKDDLSGDQKKELAKSLKPRYTRVTGLWGAQFWDPETPGYFPKTYFKASLVGYTLGMLTTLGVMHAFSHAQPALLYLVPGVLISIWGTAAVKGEMTVLWHYTENEDEDDEKKDEKEDEKEVVKGEVPETVLHLAVVRKPAVGAERSVVVTRPLKTSTVESESDRSGESDEVVVEKEGEGEAEAEDMWGTTIIGPSGVVCA
jgi:minor histocompatibility antigen H13